MRPRKEFVREKPSGRKWWHLHGRRPGRRSVSLRRKAAGRLQHQMFGGKGWPDLDQNRRAAIGQGVRSANCWD